MTGSIAQFIMSIICKSAGRRQTCISTYGETELSYLRQKDKRLGAVIDRVGPVRRAVDTDLFSAVVHHIVGQQISTKAQATIWQRMQDALGRVNAENVLAAGVPPAASAGHDLPQGGIHHRLRRKGPHRRL